MALIAAALLACAAHVAPITLDSIIKVESGGNPLTLHVNHWTGPQPVVHSAAEAATVTRHFMEIGYSVDIGIMQVNSRHLLDLGETIESILDPCHNITVGANILSAFYAKAVEQYGEGQVALLKALSAYNTGDFDKGILNGYVGRVTGATTTLASAPPVATAPVPNEEALSTSVFIRGNMRRVIIN
jgi:type IV secretion system protein VirB1